MRDTAALRARVNRHAALRWLGIALFGCGLVVVVLAFAAALHGAPLRTVGTALLATGLALGTFGANNDTAIDAMRRLSDGGVSLPPARAAELAHERTVRPARLTELHALPRLALVLPIGSMALMAWVLWTAGALLGWRAPA